MRLNAYIKAVEEAQELPAEIKGELECYPVRSVIVSRIADKARADKGLSHNELLCVFNICRTDFRRHIG